MEPAPQHLTLAALVSALAPGEPFGATLPHVDIHSVVVDSRQAVPNSLFVALRGVRTDGHDYLAQAIANGAVAVLAERLPPVEARPLVKAPALEIWHLGNSYGLVVPSSLIGLQEASAYWRRQQPVELIGVTGSVGKTTSKEAIAAVLRQRYCTHKSSGNLNNEIGLPLTLLQLGPEHERAVVEMGMYALGEIARLAELARPRIGVVTNVGPIHLERLGTLDRIAQAKAELPKALPRADDGGVAILNRDDERVWGMANLTRARVFSYGLGPEADLWAEDIQSEGLSGIHFRLHHQVETVHVRVPMLGRHSVHTALSAAAVGLVEGLSWSEIVAGLRDQTAHVRLVAVLGPKGSTLLDDTYNAGPASCIAALNLLDELDGRKLAVLGDMYELGPHEMEGHKMVGRRARDVADRLVTVGRLGRIIGDEAIAAGMATGSVHQVATNAEAICLLSDLIEAGDIVLVKGSRGLQMEEIVAALSQPTVQEGSWESQLA